MMRVPQVERADGLPTAVTVYEVGPRDGLQNESAVVPVEVKAEFITRLAAAGLSAIEMTSFVHPEWVPQLADAEELLDLIDLDAAVRMPVLVPNERGLDRALAKGVREIAIFGSATETFAQRNLNRGLDEQYAMFEPVVARARSEAVRVRGYLSMCFGDPWEGEVDDRGGRSAQRDGSSTSAVTSCRWATRSGLRRRATSTRCCPRWSMPGRPSRRSPCISTTPTGRRCPTR